MMQCALHLRFVSGPATYWGKTRVDALMRPCSLRRGGVVVLISVAHVTKGARNAGSHRTRVRQDLAILKRSEN
jgi:hypothetical protein